MMEQNTKHDSYHIISKTIHWVTALLILGLLFVGFYMNTLDFSENKLQIYALHKSFGLLVLILACVRIVWHIIKRKPKPLKTHRKWEKVLAHLAHLVLYLALFIMPISGWVMSSAGDFTVQFFGIDVPDIVEKDKGLFQASREVHEVVAFLLLAFIGLHALGALKHHFVDRDSTLQRMTVPSLGFAGGVFLVMILACLYIPSGILALQALQKEFSSAADHMTTQKEQVVTSDIDDASQADLSSDVMAWEVDLEKSHVEFSATQYGQAFTGRFKIHKAEILFDETALEDSKVHVEIDIVSINTGSDDRDSQALSEDWFNAENYPYAVFEAEGRFEKQGANQFRAQGYLSLRDVKLPLSLPFTLEMSTDDDGQKKAVMTSNLELNRLEYGVGQGKWESTDAIGDSVTLNITTHAVARQ